MNTRRTPPPASASRRAPVAQRGAAVVEFVIFVPFLLAIMALVWDVREQLAFRTDIARQIHIAAAAAADDPEGTQPFDVAMGRLNDLLGRGRDGDGPGVSGSVAAAVVRRGTVRRDGTACPVDEWCPPAVAATWPATAADGTWTEDGDACATPPAEPLPASDAVFAATAAVLPYESRAGADESAWLSRNLGPDEWWVVMDICFEPRGGTFSGRLANLPLRLFDATPVLRRRIAWGSIHELRECDWCGA